MVIRISGTSLLPPAARKTALLARACRLALGPKARRAGELNVVFVGRAEMRRLNWSFLRHRHDTDVIAFPYAPVPGDPAPAFGDVYVSAHMVRAQARALGHPPLTEALTLVLHGTLHLLGYRDSSPALKARMFRRQDRLLARLAR